MSNISTTHNLIKLDKSSKALSGQRLIRLIAKMDKTGEYQCPNLVESLCVSVPQIELGQISTVQFEALKPHLMGLIFEAQNQIVRELRIDSGTSFVQDSAISIDKCIEFMDSISRGNRLTTEFLSNWFIELYSDAAAEFIAKMCKFSGDSNLWTPEQIKVIEVKSNVLNSMFAGFSSGKYSPNIPKCAGMIKFGEFLGAENMDSRMSNFVQKAVKIRAEKTAELSSDALGFEE